MSCSRSLSQHNNALIVRLHRRIKAFWRLRRVSLCPLKNGWKRLSVRMLSKSERLPMQTLAEQRFPIFLTFEDQKLDDHLCTSGEFVSRLCFFFINKQQLLFSVGIQRLSNWNSDTRDDLDPRRRRDRKSVKRPVDTRQTPAHNMKLQHFIHVKNQPKGGQDAGVGAHRTH